MNNSLELLKIQKHKLDKCYICRKGEHFAKEYSQRGKKKAKATSATETKEMETITAKPKKAITVATIAAFIKKVDPTNKVKEDINWQKLLDSYRDGSKGVKIEVELANRMLVST